MCAYMFQNCPLVDDLTVLYTGAHGAKWRGWSNLWLDGAADTGVYHCYRAADTSTRSEGGIPANWRIEYLDSLPLVFTAEQANSSVAMQVVKLRVDGSAPTASFEYSTDGTTWTAWTDPAQAIVLANVGDKVYVRSAELEQQISNQYGYRNFVLTGKLGLGGSVMSLFANSEVDQKEYYVPFVKAYGLYGLFANCSALAGFSD